MDCGFETSLKIDAYNETFYQITILFKKNEKCWQPAADKSFLLVFSKWPPNFFKNLRYFTVKKFGSHYFCNNLISFDFSVIVVTIIKKSKNVKINI
jgi:hypothetical protein